MGSCAALVCAKKSREIMETFLYIRLNWTCTKKVNETWKYLEGFACRLKSNPTAWSSSTWRRPEPDIIYACFYSHENLLFESHSWQRRWWRSESAQKRALTALSQTWSIVDQSCVNFIWSSKWATRHTRLLYGKWMNQQCDNWDEPEVLEVFSGQLNARERFSPDLELLFLS